MNTTKHAEVNRRRLLLAAAVAFILVMACSAMRSRPDGTAAAQPQAGAEQAAHRVYRASRKVGAAGSLAETRFAAGPRWVITTQRDNPQLYARTREAGAARALGATARAQDAEQKGATDQARSESDAPHAGAARSEQQAAEQRARTAKMVVLLALLEAISDPGRPLQ